jgi:flagellar protein FliO/FliZ
MIRAAAVALGAAAPLAALAADAAAASPLAGTLQSLAALGAVVLAILGTAWLLRRLQRGGTVGSTLVRTIAATPVGPRERVVLVEVQDTWLVLGVAQGSVRTLHTLPRADTPRSAQQGFAAWLARAKGERRDA